MEISKLIKDFEKDVNSNAGKKLVAQGLTALPEIIEHLSDNIPSSSLELQTAWGKLLADMEKDIDILKSGPAKYTDYYNWISWAKRMVK